MKKILYIYFILLTKIVVAQQHAPMRKTNLEPKTEVNGDVQVITSKEPEFPGGAKALQKYLADKIVYPEVAIDKGEQGTVYIQMIIELDGRITNAHILRGVSIDIDVEAMRVVKGMPKWIPAEVDGISVRVRYNLPINFRLD